MLTPREALRWARFAAQFLRFRRLALIDGRRNAPRWRDRQPCLHDRSAVTAFDRHYVYHTAWAARVLSRLAPAHHVDIGSSLYFCSIVSAFLPVQFFDFRPPILDLSGLTVAPADLEKLPFTSSTLESVSCMHVLEHIGLGRYGDRLAADGDARAAAELRRVLAPGGTLLLAAPVGRPRVRFNAHRIYARSEFLALFPGFAVREFALIPDRAEDGGLLVDPPEELIAQQDYACGCFWLERTPC